MAKMGRPFEENPRDCRVTVRLTKEEYERLMQYSESHNLKMSKAVLAGLEKLYESEKGDQ